MCFIIFDFLPLDMMNYFQRSDTPRLFCYYRQLPAPFRSRFESLQPWQCWSTKPLDLLKWIKTTDWVHDACMVEHRVVSCLSSGWPKIQRRPAEDLYMGWLFFKMTVTSGLKWRRAVFKGRLKSSLGLPVDVQLWANSIGEGVGRKESDEQTLPDAWTDSDILLRAFLYVCLCKNGLDSGNRSIKSAHPDATRLGWQNGADLSIDRSASFLIPTSSFGQSNTLTTFSQT